MLGLMFNIIVMYLNEALFWLPLASLFNFYKENSFHFIIYKRLSSFFIRIPPQFLHS